MYDVLALGERWRRLRDRLVASRRFQRWAAAFPLTRPIARRRARGLFDLVAGFVYSQVLFAGVQLGLFQALAGGPRSARDLAAELGLSEPAMERLLRAAAAIDLVETRSGDRFGLGPLGAPLSGNPGLLALIEHHGALYRDLSDPVALLRDTVPDTQLARYWAYAKDGDPSGLPDERVLAYTDLMASSQSAVAEEVLDAYDLSGHRCLMDVGGGSGAFCAAAGARYPQLQLKVFDLPAVAAAASARFAGGDLAARATAHGGDFHRDNLPAGADIISLVRVVHDHGDADALHLLKAVRRALPPDGTLLIAEQLSGTRGAEPVGDAYFGFYLLAMGRGRPRTVAEMTRLLADAGFATPREIRTHVPLQARVLIARPRDGQPGRES